eukprot:CAMPEP_0203661292 /NCGR_PEP_ID=MMETSP0088-20131115/59534_1 /ASSEMBLY_ACC=CAM_ASM_001087 /TAXON_ID=426623 /ORGANISM="Chaetoceros affinis, Strain CCMP159" /LENGTH=607 /DNA_ID=CAMNT_0050523955 /DNA_START=102 /DNA_END=1925 /DNA_ORIENTATION=-
MTTAINTCTTTPVRVIPMLVLLLNLFLLIDVTSFSFVKASTSSSSTSSSGSIGSGIGLNIDISSPKYERVLNIRHGGSVNLESPSATVAVSSASASGNNNGTTSSTAYEYILPEEATSAPSGLDADTDVVGVSKGAGVNISSPVLGGEPELEFTEQQVTKKQKKLKVLFLSADTGGGHRASAQSLGSQLLKHYPDTEFELADLWTPTNVYPYATLVKSYKHLSAHPRQWRLLYYLSNTKWYEKITDVHSSITCYDKIEKHIESLDPDIVISVHPTMNYVPEKAVRNIGQKKGKYIPFFTVVTDFGSGHCTWFQGRTVDMIYVASQRIMKLAKRRGKFDHDKLVMSGLPIREDFAVQAKAMGDRSSLGGKGYRQVMKSKLGLDPHKKTVLVMGGGEGVGSLGQIAEKLREKLANSGVDATILVVCGRNEKLKDDLNGRDWGAEPMAVGRIKKRAKLRQLAKRILRKKVSLEEKAPSEIGNSGKGEVDVIGLGFITNMAEFMVAADVLVSKAGPGTIAEAASLGLPVMITSFLPGQEAGNVDIVLDGGFGAFKKKPHQIADVVTSWMGDEDKLDEMSRRSSEVGNPQAASEIMEDIIRISLEKINKFDS